MQKIESAFVIHFLLVHLRLPKQFNNYFTCLFVWDAFTSLSQTIT